MVDERRVEREVEPRGDVDDAQAGRRRAPRQQRRADRLRRVQQRQQEHVQVERELRWKVTFIFNTLALGLSVEVGHSGNISLYLSVI